MNMQPVKANNLWEGRVPPQNIDAERSVLGSMMLDQESRDVAIGILKAEYFYSPVNGIIFETIRKLVIEEKHRQADLIVVSNRLKDMGELEKVGGAGYISGLLNVVPTVENAEHYARIVTDKAALRALIKACYICAERSYGAKSFDVIYDDFSRLSSNVEEILGYSVEDWFEFLDTYRRKIRTAYSAEDDEFVEERGWMTGYKNFDAESGGLFPGRFYAIAGRNKHGKTTLALNFGEGFLENNQDSQILFVSLEMQAMAVMDKLVSIRVAKLGASDVIPLRAIQERSAYRCIPAVRNIGLHFGDGWIIRDRRGQGVDEVIRVIKRAKRANPNVKIIIIDYMQKFVDPRGKRDYTHYENVCAKLFDEAGESQVAIILLAQAGRGVARENRMPNDADIYGGDALDQYADQINAIFDPYYGRPEEERTYQESNKERLIQCRTLKNKYGPVIDWTLQFTPNVGWMFERVDHPRIHRYNQPEHRKDIDGSNYYPDEKPKVELAPTLDLDEMDEGDPHFGL